MHAFMSNVFLIIAAYAEYNRNYKDLPESIQKDTVEYLTWQKDRHKLERDFYLSLCCIIAQL
jgi:hypothetical protein